MKNLSTLLIGLLLSTAIVSAAENVKVSAISEFNTTTPVQTIDVRVIEPAELGKYALYPENILHCEVVGVTSATRGKRDASFAVKPISITADGETVNIDDAWVGGYSKRVLSKEELKNIDKGQLALSATKSVGNLFVKGFGQGISFAAGVVQSKGEKPIRSGIKKVYKDSPLSYVEKGEELSITPNDTFYFVFKEVKE